MTINKHKIIKSGVFPRPKISRCFLFSDFLFLVSSPIVLSYENKDATDGRYRKCANCEKPTSIEEVWRLVNNALKYIQADLDGIEKINNQYKVLIFQNTERDDIVVKYITSALVK
jgi:hypothetical protein